MLKKLPPLEKVYEAWSALADKRVRKTAAGYEIDSSDRAKTYTVIPDGNVYAATDSATYWQGYPGYPVLAVWMLEGRLPYHKDLAENLKGVPWKELNDKHKRNYAAAAEEAFAGLSEDTVSDMKKAAAEIMLILPQLDVSVKRGKK